MPNSLCSRQRRLFRLGAVVGLVCISGATCQRNWTDPFGATIPAAPEVLAQGAQLQQVVGAINQNTARVHSLMAPNALITVPHSTLLPPLRGNLALERPQRFRLTAGTGLTGQEVDLGSNDEHFWLWIRRSDPPGVYFCRHDQFGGSASGKVMPIEPRWLQSAFGLVELDSSQVYSGPIPRGDGTVELRTYLPSANGTLQRVLVIDAKRAWVKEQHVYDPTGTQLIASTVATSHRYYPLEQVSLPERVAIRVPASQLAFTIDLGQLQINRLPANSAQLWTMPAFDGYQQFDLGIASPNIPLSMGHMSAVGRYSLADKSPAGNAYGQLAAPAQVSPRPRRPFARLFGKQSVQAAQQRVPIRQGWQNPEAVAGSSIQPTSFLLPAGVNHQGN